MIGVRSMRASLERSDSNDGGQTGAKVKHIITERMEVEHCGTLWEAGLRTQSLVAACRMSKPHSHTRRCSQTPHVERRWVSHVAESLLTAAQLSPKTELAKSDSAVAARPTPRLRRSQPPQTSTPRNCRRRRSSACCRAVWCGVGLAHATPCVPRRCTTG